MARTSSQPPGPGRPDQEPPPPTITIYRGESNAAAGTNAVAMGVGEVTFTPNPIEVYFAKVSGPDGAIPVYVVEIDSDCTAETPFPSITGPFVASATPVTRGNSVTITVPVDVLTEEVSLELVAADGSLNGTGTVVATLDTVARTASATLATSVGMAAGSYVVRAKVSTIAADMTLEHQSAYLVDPAFSTTQYAVDQINYAAGTFPFPTMRKPTAFPLTTVVLE